MKTKPTSAGIDRYTPIGKIADDLKRVLKAILLPLAALMVVGVVYLAASNSGSAAPFGPLPNPLIEAYTTAGLPADTAS